MLIYKQNILRIRIRHLLFLHLLLLLLLLFLLLLFFLCHLDHLLFRRLRLLRLRTRLLIYISQDLLIFSFLSSMLSFLFFFFDEQHRILFFCA